MVEIAHDYENLEAYFPFPTKRDGQDNILKSIKKYLIDPDIRYIILEAETGCGKSAIALAAAGASKASYLATANKFLQNQYSKDFSDIMVDLKGRVNYRCDCYDVPENMKETIGGFYNCGNSPCRASKTGRAECMAKSACEYHRQLCLAKQSDITCFNFASALAFLNHTSYFKERNLLICDECHNIPNWITNFVSIEITAKTLAELQLNKDIPDYKTVEDYGLFISEIQRNINYQLDNEELVDHKIIHKLENFQNKLSLFDTITDNKENMGNFVMEKVYDLDNKRKIIKLSFNPVVVSDIVDTYLFSHAKKVILMSATILDFKTYVDMMGIDPKYTAVIRVPSTFPVKNRPIYTHMSVGYINKDNLDVLLPDIVKNIKVILDHYKDVKGIIHGVTYKICDYLHDNLDSKRILYPRKAEQQQEYFQYHTQSDKPTILLSPSMTEGVDLKDDLSRLQIFAKTPFAYFGNPVLQARIKIYTNYYNLLTALAITQAYGRSIRSELDICHTYFLDRQTVNFCDSNIDIMQQSLMGAIHRHTPR